MRSRTRWWRTSASPIDMFEAMMLKFQEDTVRFLFRMQILGPDGQPVDAAPRPSRDCAPGSAGGQRRSVRPRSMRSRARSAFTPAQPSTTIDALEKEFHRKKQRELEAASRSGAATPASPRSAAPARKWAATIPAPAAAARSTRNVTELRSRLVRLHGVTQHQSKTPRSKNRSLSSPAVAPIPG